MKSILYVGATLMIGASIYGFVDYKQTSKKNEFKKMYSDEKILEPQVIPSVEKDQVAVSTDVFNNEKKVTAQRKNLKKKFVNKDVAVIEPVADADAIAASDPVTLQKTDVNIIADEENVTVKKVKNRKFNSKLFSRAPLREEYIEEKLPKPAKQILKSQRKKLKKIKPSTHPYPRPFSKQAKCAGFFYACYSYVKAKQVSPDIISISRY